MIKPLPCSLMAVQALSLLTIVSTPSANGLALPPLLLGAACTIWLKLHHPLGHSRLVGASSILFVLGGPMAFAATCTLGLQTTRINLCCLLVYLVGCLFYWVSLGDGPEPQPL